jgi:RNA polymerase sigma-70 factor (ECF subfamily)
VWPKENSDEDRELVRRCQNGDDQAFEALVRKYQQSLFKVICHNVGRRDDVEDIAQKIFFKVYFTLRRFDNNRPFFPWLYRIAVNQCYDEMRRSRRRRWITFSDLNLQDSENLENFLKGEETVNPLPEDRQELHDLLYSMLDRLPEKQRRALVLRDLEDVPYERMAEIMGCTEQAARLKVFRARIRLRNLMLKKLHRADPPSAGRQTKP